MVAMMALVRDKNKVSPPPRPPRRRHGFKGVQASQGAGGAPQRLGAQGALQGDAFEAALLEKMQLAPLVPTNSCLCLPARIQLAQYYNRAIACHVSTQQPAPSINSTKQQAAKSSRQPRAASSRAERKR
jgi:hypothetical protein